ncbi:MAG: ribosome maturation factor RimM, partial [Pseudomonadota bacterium]|nr:ribosome maturation factor RimM [Pseudomonadota bacterium]
MAQWVVMGRVGGLYGVRGWVKVFSYTQPRAGII